MQETDGNDIWKIKNRKVKPTNLLHKYQMGQFQNWRK